MVVSVMVEVITHNHRSSDGKNARIAKQQFHARSTRPFFRFSSGGVARDPPIACLAK